MRSVVAFPGTMAHAQQVARALAQRGALDAFVTTFSYRADGALARVARALPESLGARATRQLMRRRVDLPDALVHSTPGWEIARTLLAQTSLSPTIGDRVWDHASFRFDAMVARRFVPRTQAIHAFEYTARAAFERAGELGVARVLHMPSLDSRAFETIRLRERADFPELAGPHDPYFARRFETRYARRCAETALADVIVANSTLTARSHIAAGVDPAKLVVVPLGAPPARDALIAADETAPLRVIWAGPFTLRKGAHLLLQAWRMLNAGAASSLEVYGAQRLPQRCLAGLPAGITFHGSVPQAALFEAFARGDVLVFPTLSDGFGMVVTEAMAQGLPVITTQEAGAADLITPHNGRIIKAGDAAAIVDALRWCLDERSALAAMRAHALATARAWQWSDYRGALIERLEPALRAKGFAPDFARRAGL